jgi:hypothetical protein
MQDPAGDGAKPSMKESQHHSHSEGKD